MPITPGPVSAGSFPFASQDDFDAHVADQTDVHGGLTIDASNQDAFIAGGLDNSVAGITARGGNPKSAHVSGYANRAMDWYAHVSGAGCIGDGKISTAEGNACICSGHDSHAEGNRTVTGRRFFLDVTYGSEDAGSGLGTLQYVLIPDSYGDVTSYFPNALTDDLTGRYGSGTTADTKGNVYASGYTAAVWSGDTVTTANDLIWAMHRICILRGGEDEDELAFATIAKATYSGGTGTKVYYEGAKPYTTILGIYSSYGSLLLNSGNSMHSEGYITQAVGWGAHSEGYETRAWGARGSHAEGMDTLSSGDLGAHAEGYLTTGSGDSSHAEGRSTTASAANAHAEGLSTTASASAAHAEGSSTTASGARSHAEGGTTTASGIASHAEGDTTVASGEASHASGLYSVASRNYQQAYASGKRSVAGDNQVTRISYGKSCADAGWHPVNVLLDLVDDRTYHFETMVVGRQTAAPSAGTVGNSFAYRITGAITTAAGALTVLGTQTVDLVGRTSGMTGDGVTTGPRVTAYTSIYNGDLICRYDGEAGSTWYITTHSTIQELA